MSDLFKDVYINRILSHEGGYVNHPNDPGGETKWGIAKRSHPNVDIRNLTRDGAIEIYRKEYWQPVEALNLPVALQFQVLDASINHGLSRAVSLLQRAVGVADDGDYGPVTHNTVWATNDLAVGAAFNRERLRFYTNLGTFGPFGKGWVRRVADNLTYLIEDAVH